MTPPRPRTFSDPRSWWCCWPAREHPTALPAYLARAWRRARDAQNFLNELRTQGVGIYRGSKVVKVRVTVETI